LLHLREEDPAAHALRGRSRSQQRGRGVREPPDRGGPAPHQGEQAGRGAPPRTQAHHPGGEAPPPPGRRRGRGRRGAGGLRMTTTTEATILVVDDDRDCREIAARLLEREGY